MISNIARTVKQVIIEESKVQIMPEELSDNEPLTSGILNIDSLTFIRMVISLEQALGSQFDDSILMQTEFRSVGDLVQYIEGQISHG